MDPCGFKCATLCCEQKLDCSLIVDRTHHIGAFISIIFNLSDNHNIVVFWSFAKGMSDLCSMMANI